MERAARTDPGGEARTASRPGFADACRVLLFLCSIAGLAPAIASSSAATDPLRLIPAPRTLVEDGGPVAISQSWSIEIAPGDSSDLEAARAVQDEVRGRYGWTWPIETAPAPGAAVVIRPGENAAGLPRLFEQQGYRLSIRPSRILIEAPAAVGRFYGAQTLRQMLRTSADRCLPSLRIVDYPSLEWRGVSDDISRGQISTAGDFRAIIDRLAYYKLNLYQPYIEDAFEFATDPSIGRGHGALSRDEEAAIAAEARRQHVSIAPIFETMSHQSRMLSLPSVRRFAGRSSAKPGGPIIAWREAIHCWALGARLAWLADATESADDAAPPVSFSTTSEAAVSFVTRLVDEISAALPGPFFHVGGDERIDEESDTTRRPGDRGATPAAPIRYLARLREHLRRAHHRELMLYSDLPLASPRAFDRLSRDFMVVDWHYDPSDSFSTLDSLRAHGFTRLIVSPGLWNWATFHPNLARAFPNIGVACAAARRAEASGCVAASWQDGGAESLRENNWPGYAYAAAASWEIHVPPRDGFLRRFVATEFGSDSEDLARAEALVGWQQFENIGWNGRLAHLAPRPRVPRPEWIERMTRLRADMITARQAIAETRRGRVINPDELMALEFSARRYAFIADRELLLSRWPGSAPEIAPVGSAGRAPSPASQAFALADEATALARDGAALWLKHNQRPGLDSLVTRLDRQSAALLSLGGRQ